VPLDPVYPRERLAFMLEDAEVSVLLTQQSLIEDGGWRIEDSESRSSILNHRSQVVCVDRDWETINRENGNNVNSGGRANNLAYVIYTSGSTGTPKGVQIKHRSVINCLHSIRQQIDLTEKDVLLALTTISFDISALETYLPLTTGAKLVLASRDEALDGSQLIGRLTECGATAMQATPSTWKLLLDAGWRSSRNFKILCGGEVLSRPVADQLLEGGASLWNLYGPTETTIWSTIAKVEPGESPLPIGRPIANTQTYILDSHLQPVPIRVHGELYIGGDGLAQGYLNRPELSAERFVVHPFSDQAGSRLYRTGDVVRYRPDGNIEFLGRLDNQVKIRGHRIEPGEIEAALNQHPGVKEVVVVARARDSSEERELVSYIVLHQDSAASASDLRSLLRQRLPDYMIPSAFVFLSALPLTPNGKVDRSKLPPPDDSRPAIDQGFVEPRSEIEKLVAQVWREVLKLEKIDVYENFFDVGGHSLLATRVISRIRDLFHIDMPLRTVFEAPTIAGLVQVVEAELQSSQKIERQAILPRLDEEPVPPSIAQEPLLLFDRSLPGISLFNIPAVYRLKGPLDVAALERSLNQVVERHEALRTTFPMVNGQNVQFISPSISIKLETSDLGNLPGEDRDAEIRKLAREEAEQPFDLANGPLFRVKLLRLGDQDHVLLVIIHHIISDGGSMVVFFRDLAVFYEMFSLGRLSSLPGLPIQYADFSQWQRQSLKGELMESQLTYWKKQLDNPPSQFEFSTGRPRIAELSFLTARKSVAIEGDLVELLKKLSQKEESTLFTTLLTVFKVLLYCWTGEKDVRVGTLVENRNRKETENLIGHFVNTLIMRTKVSHSFSFRQLSRLVRDVTLAAYAHQDLPFEVLVRALESEKNLDRTSLCQVMFIYQTFPLSPIKLLGLTVGRVDDIMNVDDPDFAITTFDLIVLLKEQPVGVVGSLIYKVDLFDETTINRIIAHFYAILRRVISKPDQPVSELCYLEETQR
jgi:amino acid adenylation domain-containing protein